MSSKNQTPGCVVLYVEDDDATAYLFQHAMQEAGAHVRLYRVSDGAKAIAFLQHDGTYAKAPKPDLVILDVNLPKKTGFDVLAVIRQTEALKDTPVVMLSTSILPEDRERAIALGALKFFSKSSDYEGFFETAKSICAMVSSPRAREYRAADPVANHIDYCLHILGIRVWESACQLIARAQDESAWTLLGPERALPIELPYDEATLKAAGNDALRITAWQYELEHPGTDIREILSQRKEFWAALSEHNPPVAKDVSNF